MRREHVAEIGSRGRKEPRYVRPLVGRTALRLVRPHRRPPARLPQNSGIADAARTPIPGLGELAFLWNADEPATYPNAGNNPAAPGIFPPLGGIRFIIGTYLPGDFIAPEPTPEMHLEDGDELGGANAGFHRTDTTDFGVVLSGNLALQLDDGAEVSLSPGDVLIENGTRHRWRVVGDVPATLASFIIGAQRR